METRNNKEPGKPEQASEIAKSQFPAGLTMEQLFTLFLQQQRDLADANRRLADAIQESHVPYVDPKVQAAKDFALAERKRMIERERKLRESRKKVCPHVRENGTSNIKWMQHSNNIILGVCGSCFAQFDATHNRADAALLRNDLKSLKNMAKAGPHAVKGAEF